jgi:hypothetical protein
MAAIWSGETRFVMDDSIKELLEIYPFLSFGWMQDKNYLGVVQNCDAQLISMYILTDIPTEELRKNFLNAAADWWWGSNRQVPINIFLKERFLPYRQYLKHFARKEFNLEAGPVVSLQDAIARRVRKRQITLVRRT